MKIKTPSQTLCWEFVFSDVIFQKSQKRTFIDQVCLIVFVLFKNEGE